MKFWIFGLLCCLLIPVAGQREVMGKVLDKETGEPIPYVNIGLLGKTIGTVSNEKGAFRLVLPRGRSAPDDLVRFSSLGYLPQEIPLGKLLEAEFVTAHLQPSAMALDEVVVSTLPTYTLEEMVGYPLQSTRDFAYWKDSLALGAELGCRIRVSPGLRKLNTLFFRSLQNPSDSLRLRVNFYAYSKGGGPPGSNLNKSGKSILYTLPGGSYEAVVDLEPFDIWVEDDFVTSLELLQVYGSDRISLSMPAAEESRGVTFRRYASQGRWENIGTYGVGYYLQTTYYTDDPRKAINKKVERRLKRTQGIVSGFVFYGRRGLQDVLVENLNTNNETRTDDRGRYSIPASPGDILRYTRPGSDFLILRIRELGNVTVNLKGQ